MARFVRVQPSAKADFSSRRSCQRDASGHIDPKHEHRLLSIAREGHNADGTKDSEHAFIAGRKTREMLGEELGEAFLESATTGEPCEMERFDQVTEDEDGGPFVLTLGEEEFADGVDGSNTSDATREPFPRTSNIGSERSFPRGLGSEFLGPTSRPR